MKVSTSLMLLVAYVHVACVTTTEIPTTSSTATSLTSTPTTTQDTNIDSLGITPCMLACITPAATENRCSGIADIPCVCSSSQFQVDAKACLEEHCSKSDLEAALNLQKVQCGAVSITPTGTPGPPKTVSFTSPTATATGYSATSSTSTSPAGEPTESSNNEAVRKAVGLSGIAVIMVGVFAL